MTYYVTKRIYDVTKRIYYVTKRIYDVVQKPAIYPPTSWIWGVPRRVSDYDIIENLLYTHLYHGFGGVPRWVSDYDIVPTI